jgi:hypothetical protein
MYMGRNRKYFTDEEKTQANRNAVMRYYERNKDAVKKKNLERYYETINKK